MTEVQELKKVAEQLSEGQWIPFALIGVLVGVIGVVVLAWWFQVQKNNQIIHEQARKDIDKNTDLIEQAVKNNSELTVISAKFDVLIEGQQAQINENRRKINQAS